MKSLAYSATVAKLNVWCELSLNITRPTNKIHHERLTPSTVCTILTTALTLIPFTAPFSTQTLTLSFKALLCKMANWRSSTNGDFRTGTWSLKVSIDGRLQDIWTWSIEATTPDHKDTTIAFQCTFNDDVLAGVQDLPLLCLDEENNLLAKRKFSEKYPALRNEFEQFHFYTMFDADLFPQGCGIVLPANSTYASTEIPGHLRKRLKRQLERQRPR